MNEGQLKALVETFGHPLLIDTSHHKETQFYFTLQGKNRRWRTRFFFDDLFPYSLPHVFLLEEDMIGTIPHVNVEGLLCIDVSDSVIVDYTCPGALISTIIESAVDLLDLGSLKVNRMELTDEYEGFFEPISNRIPGNVIGANMPQKVYLKIWRPTNGKQTAGEPFLVYDDGQALPEQYSNFTQANAFQTIKAVYIPTQYPMLPPQGTNNLDSKYIYDILSLVEAPLLKEIDKIISKFSSAREHYILFGLPRSKGMRSLVLFRMTSPKPMLHPLKEKSLGWEVKTYLINRHDKGYLLERGGADTKLLNSSVAIIGCGSVGSEISVMLAKAGIGHLILIDNDFLEIDNIYRHRLGGRYLSYEPVQKIGKVPLFRKVNALANFLETELPYIQVDAIPKRAESILSERALINADVIISAVGSPGVNLYLNKAFKTAHFKKIVYCWNEAASAGGHALSVNLDSSCYECQFWRTGKFSLASPLNLVMPGQHLTKNLTGCAGVFTPFSYLDSSQTAMITTRLCIETIKNNALNKVVSWKNPNITGVGLTERYYEMAMIEETAYDKACSCGVCHNG